MSLIEAVPPTQPCPLVEDFPCLRFGALKRSGVFEKDAWRRVSLENSAEMLDARMRDALTVELSWLGGRQILTLVEVPATFGARKMFVCPETGERCTTLFLDRDRFVGRKAVKMAYSSQREPERERQARRAGELVSRLVREDHRRLRGARRRRVIDQVAVLADVLDASGLAVLAAERDRLSRASRRRRPRPDDPPMSCRKALERGRSWGELNSKAVQFRLYGDGQDLPHLYGWGLKSLPRTKTPRSLVPALDIRQLRLRPGSASGHLLRWNVEGYPDLSCLAHIQDGYLHLEFWSSNSFDCLGRQAILVEDGSRRGDLFALCPVTGERHVLLYWRERRFASAPAQGLR